jgi:hypothetical protein
MRPEQNGLQSVGWATAPDGVSQPPTLTHPAIDPGFPPSRGLLSCTTRTGKPPKEQMRIERALCRESGPSIRAPISGDLATS